MNFYFVEVKSSSKPRGKNKIVGFHDTGADKALPDPLWGGDACYRISRFTYDVLKACRGDIKALIILAASLDEWLEGDSVTSEQEK